MNGKEKGAPIKSSLLTSSSSSSLSRHYNDSATNELPLSDINFPSNPLSPEIINEYNEGNDNGYNLAVMFSQLHDERPKISPLATNERPLSCHCFSRLSSVNSIDSIYEFIENKNEDMELSSFSDTSSSSSQSGTSHYFSIYSPIPSEISPTTPIPNRIYSSSYPFNLMSEIYFRRSSLPASCLTNRKVSLMTTVLNRYNDRHNEIDVNTDDFDDFMRNNNIMKSNYYSIDNENTDDVLMPLATSLQKTQQLQFHTNDDYNNCNNPIASNRNPITSTTITITPSISITDITHNPSIAIVSSTNENNTNPLFKIVSTPLPPPSTTTTNTTVSETTTTTTITTISETITINPTPPPPPTTTTAATKINNLLNLNNLSTNTILITPQNQYDISETNPTASEQNHHHSVSGIVHNSSDGVHNNNSGDGGGGGGGGVRGNVNSPNTTATSTASMRRQRHRHSIAGQMSYFKMLGLGGSGKKMATSANSLFSTAVISGSSSAPNLRDMIANTASPSGIFFFLQIIYNSNSND